MIVEDCTLLLEEEIDEEALRLAEEVSGTFTIVGFVVEIGGTGGRREEFEMTEFIFELIVEFAVNSELVEIVEVLGEEGKIGMLFVGEGEPTEEVERVELVDSEAGAGACNIIRKCENMRDLQYRKPIDQTIKYGKIGRDDYFIVDADTGFVCGNLERWNHQGKDILMFWLH